MEFVNKTWRKIVVRKQTDQTPTPLITVRHNSVVEASDSNLIEEYKEAGLTKMGEETLSVDEEKPKKKKKKRE